MRFFWLASRILLVSFAVTSLSAQEDLYYLVKSHQWDRLESHFQRISPTKESEVYSLIEYHEKAPNGNKETRFRYLISLVRGVFVSDTSSEEVKKILTQTMPFQTTLFRLTYWKLYSEISQKNYLNTDEKIQFLSRLNWEEDPICRKAFDELIRLLAIENKWQDIVEKTESLPDSVKYYLVTPDSQYRYGKAKLMLGDEKKAIEEWTHCLQRDTIQEYTVQYIAADWGKWKGNGNIHQLPASELTLFFPAINVADKEAIFRSRPELFSSRLQFFQGYKHLTLQLVKLDRTDDLYRTLRTNRNYVDLDPGWIGQLADILYQQNKFAKAIDLVKSFGGKDPGTYRILAASYDRLGEKNLYFENLVLYLGKYPFNLFYQDRLLDSLVIRDKGSIQYAPISKFEKALAEIPNLPVKGRLVYWYLRALDSAGEKERLKKELKRYYLFCPGSYYTRVIREEFITLIKEERAPDNPAYNKENLYEYLSHTAGIPEESPNLLGKNLGFAFPKGSYELGVRLSNAASKIQGNKTLSLATDYFRVGEDSLGLSLVHHYALKEKLSEEEKEEILVGIGDQSKNTYYTAFYTRSLLKRYMIPDDPILLPPQVSMRIFPRPHRDLVKKYADENSISEDMVYALMRQESFFKETATSRSNARGLMQIMPATGKELAQRMGVTNYSLYTPNVSIRLGTKFLAYLLKSNENQLRWASIAYNGGPGNLRKWKKQVYNGDFNHFLEDLPYKESRDYCRIVVSNYYAYDILKKYHKL
ncbi:lytic transglycosylase domain-containing protein [Leptospira idonii]|uniref:Lytic transglycosylase domain-containing protein n=1 Tax=Leptospira idonii TaxID=1193500 RepID=A0A4R9M1R8_9LEPT|nr:lytic transglycosylase domain-containing protein [Leptospira idonii]TGN19921.1 lytic transglycosylase domain-containing protein [Leptospira idonii]